jgi:hypothetical protein
MTSSPFSAGSFVLRLGGAIAAASLLTASVASAQEAPAPADEGTLVGHVADCIDGAPQPLSNARIGIEGTTLTATTDDNGQFTMQLPAGDYTVVLESANFPSVTREDVPVTQNQTIDMGTLDLGGACLNESGAPAPDLNQVSPNSEDQDNVENNGSGYDKGDDGSGGS